MSMKQCLILGAVLANAAIAVAAVWWPPILWLYVFVGPTSVLMIHDLAQTQHTVLRNYPVIGHLRYQIEDLRHQFRQYLVESDADGLPFTHGQRAAVYQRSKDVSDVLPFGTIRDVYAEGYEWLEHTAVPAQRRWSSPTRWARRSWMRSCSCTTRWRGRGCVRASGSSPAAR